MPQRRKEKNGRFSRHHLRWKYSLAQERYITASAALIFSVRNSPANERRAIDGFGLYRRCFETSLVISNILTWLLPLNTGRSESSALIMVRFFLSWQPCFLI